MPLKAPGEGLAPFSNLASYEIGIIDGGAGRQGFLVYYPIGSEKEMSDLVVFLHGYGGYNPMFYGGWIRQLVESGRVVIFPYYQDNLFQPGPESFVPLSALAIHRALEMLSRTEGTPAVDSSRIDYIGHSYGGAIAAHLAARSAFFRLPEPGAILLAMPGTGIFSAGRLSAYSGIPSDAVLGVVVGNDDRVVGDELGRHIFDSAPQVERKLWVNLASMEGDPQLTGGHNIPCSRDGWFDNRVRNYNYAKTIFTGGTDAYDRALWRLFDWMQEVRATDDWLEQETLSRLQQLGEDNNGRPYGTLRILTGKAASSVGSDPVPGY